MIEKILKKNILIRIFKVGSNCFFNRRNIFNLNMGIQLEKKV